ncbi:MAG: hypothetical protein QOG99_1653, partial [Frankiales bacterium]|nr:hypothetical protein [Frankiales bacterium]
TPRDYKRVLAEMARASETELQTAGK